jgi:hypothetical protein
VIGVGEWGSRDWKSSLINFTSSPGGSPWPVRVVIGCPGGALPVEDLLPQDVCVAAVLGEFAQYMEVQRSGSGPHQEP